MTSPRLHLFPIKNYNSQSPVRLVQISLILNYFLVEKGYDHFRASTKQTHASHTVFRWNLVNEHRSISSLFVVFGGPKKAFKDLTTIHAGLR